MSNERSETNPLFKKLVDPEEIADVLLAHQEAIQRACGARCRS